ncbi:TPA: hypothetical protein N0F65_007361 [Lagenidium giganteum]|uniref:3'-5' exonuclease domain-containing protein n=1 Tax=Lagenidium giganteum TaxID=4803 RepID=A0AAV2YI64_9STRA|nr:TPA: hypothetical protein N0F65_007361 [Lagenidium giganteum]
MTQQSPPPTQPPLPPPLPAESLQRVRHRAGKDGDGEPEPEPLAVLFQQHRLSDASRRMLKLNGLNPHDELVAAIGSSPDGASLFLRCLELLAKKEFTSAWGCINAGCSFVQGMEDPHLSEADRELAGRLLLHDMDEMRASTIATFALAFNVPRELLRSVTERMMEQRLNTAVQFMIALRMVNLLPSELVLRRALDDDDLTTADLYAKNCDRAVREQYIHMLLAKRSLPKVIKKRLSKFHFKPEDFPEFVERQNRSAMRFLLHSEKFEEALAFAHECSEDVKLHACHVIVKKRGPHDPITKQFVFRSGLADWFSDVSVDGEEHNSLPQQDEYEPNPGCFSLVEAIGEANIHFVGTQEQLQACVAHLTQQSVVGFDCEWKPSHRAGAASSPCALLQMSSLHQAFVIDMINLEDPMRLLAPIFLSETILKLGFDARGDLHTLRNMLRPHCPDKHVTTQLLDIQAVARKLHAGQGGDNNAAAADNDEGANAGDETMAENEEDAKTTTEAVADEKTNETAPKGSLNLSGVAKKYVGKPLDKRARMSDWERRPLTRAQLHYAALDAYILVLIYNNMVATTPATVMQPILNRCTQEYIS